MVHVCVYICTLAYMHVCIHVYMFVYICIFVQVMSVSRGAQPSSTMHAIFFLAFPYEKNMEVFTLMTHLALSYSFNLFSKVLVECCFLFLSSLFALNDNVNKFYFS